MTAKIDVPWWPLSARKKRTPNISIATVVPTRHISQADGSGVNLFVHISVFRKCLSFVANDSPVQKLGLHLLAGLEEYLGRLCRSSSTGTSYTVDYF